MPILRRFKVLELAYEQVEKNPNDAKVLYNFRNLCIQYSRTDLAGLKIGDIVAVRHTGDSAWCDGWQGTITELSDVHAKVLPRNNKILLKPGTLTIADILQTNGIWVDRAHLTLQSPVSP